MLTFRWSLSVLYNFLIQPLIIFWWEELGPASKIQVNLQSNVINLATENDTKFLHIDGLVHQYCNLSIYLLIPTMMPPSATVLIACIISDTQFFIWIRDSKLPGFWAGISGTQTSHAYYRATLQRYWFFFFLAWRWSRRGLSSFLLPCTNAMATSNRCSTKWSGKIGEHS